MRRYPYMPSLCAGVWAVGLISSILSGCAEIAGLAPMAEMVGIDQSLVSAMKSFEDFTPEQEYYIGRTVGAVILTKYKPYNNAAADAYVNVLGQSLARASERPETFAGYRFLILNSNDINAFAAPGGFIFITKGILRCCASEDAVAAVLAHEIGHVQENHGLKAIRQSRVTSALTSAAIDQTRKYAKADSAQLTQAFEGSIKDVTSTLTENGYSRGMEADADDAAVEILRRVGYNPSGMIEMLNQMKTRIKPGGFDFAKTHPSPEDRMDHIRGQIGDISPVNSPPARQSRFRQALKNI